jgi:hypothetical protein
MSRHFDGSPKPPYPIWLRAHYNLHLRCECGHQASAGVADLARRHRLPVDLHLWELVARLRCSRCAAKPEHVDLSQ